MGLQLLRNCDDDDVVRETHDWVVSWTCDGQTVIEAGDAAEALELFRSLGSRLDVALDPVVVAVERT